MVVSEFLGAFLQNLLDRIGSIYVRPDGIEGDGPLEVMEGLIVVVRHDCVDRPVNFIWRMTIAGGSVTGWLFLGGRLWAFLLGLDWILQRVN